MLKCVIEVKVLGYWNIQRFKGDAILTSVDPRFVVALMLGDTRSPFIVPESNVTLTTHRVAFFAINSITKLFAEGDVVGKEYRLAIEQDEIGGKKSYSLSVIG